MGEIALVSGVNVGGRRAEIDENRRSFDANTRDEIRKVARDRRHIERIRLKANREPPALVRDAVRDTGLYIELHRAVAALPIQTNRHLRYANVAEDDDAR